MNLEQNIHSEIDINLIKFKYNKPTQLHYRSV